jgi:hypothetical protein
VLHGCEVHHVQRLRLHFRHGWDTQAARRSRRPSYRAAREAKARPLAFKVEEEGSSIPVRRTLMSGMESDLQLLLFERTFFGGGLLVKYPIGLRKSMNYIWSSCCYLIVHFGARCEMAVPTLYCLLLDIHGKYVTNVVVEWLKMSALYKSSSLHSIPEHYARMAIVSLLSRVCDHPSP